MLNAEQTRATLSRLHTVIRSDEEISTISYAISPNYRTENGKSSISGYTASNTVEVSTDDLADAGKLIDAASAGGANQIQNLQFGLQDQNRAEAQALNHASLEARSNAAAMANALGVKLGAVISMSRARPKSSGPGEPSMFPWRASPRPSSPVRWKSTLV